MLLGYDKINIKLISLKASFNWFKGSFESIFGSFFEVPQWCMIICKVAWFSSLNRSQIICVSHLWYLSVWLIFTYSFIDTALLIQPIINTVIISVYSWRGTCYRFHIRNYRLTSKYFLFWVWSTAFSKLRFTTIFILSISASRPIKSTEFHIIAAIKVTFIHLNSALECFIFTIYDYFHELCYIRFYIFKIFLIYLHRTEVLRVSWRVELWLFRRLVQ